MSIYGNARDGATIAIDAATLISGSAVVENMAAGDLTLSGTGGDLTQFFLHNMPSVSDALTTGRVYVDSSGYLKVVV